MAANFLRTKAVQADATIKEPFQHLPVSKSGDPCCLPLFRVATSQKSLKLVALFTIEQVHLEICVGLSTGGH